MSSVCLAEPATRTRNRILDKRLGICAGLVVCILFIAGMKGLTYHEPIKGDPAVYAVIGHELLNGRRLYADLWDHKPPAIHATFALAELVVGFGPQQLYLLNIAALTITLIGLYRAGSLLGGTRAGVCAAIVWALGSIFPHWQGYQPNTELFVNTFLVWGFYFVCRLNSAPRWSLALAFGAAIGIASLYKQIVIAPAALLGLAYIFRSGSEMKDRWPALRYMLVAGGVSMAVWVGCVVWCWSQGTLADFYDAVFVYNRHYLGSPIRNLLQARHFEHKSYLLAVAIPCLLVPFAGPRLDRTQRDGWFFLAAWTAGCFIAHGLTGRWQEYYLEIWMPIYALAAGAMFAGLSSGQIERPRAWRWALLAMVLGPLAIRCVQRNQFDSPPWLVYEPGSQEYRFRHSSREAGLAINQMLLPGERMYALGTPGESAPLYFYTHQSPPSGVIFDFPLRPSKPKPLAVRLEDRIVRDLDRDPPDLIVSSAVSFMAVSDGKPAEWGQRLKDWVSPRYSSCGSDPTKRFLLFARRGSALERRLAQGEKP
jgi:Dolichyl-phosphate-mannose-protein mannosyltransferase